MAIIALTAPGAVAAVSHTGRALVSSFLVRGLILAVILGVAWYMARRRRM
jgi:hypothetical protein